MKLDLLATPTHISLTPLPPGVFFDPDGLRIHGHLDADGTHTLVLQAANQNGLQRQQLKLTAYPPTGAPPVVTSPSAVVVRQNFSFLHQLTATDLQPGSPVESDLPGSLFFDSTTHQLTGRLYALGDHSIQIRLSNLYGVTEHTLRVSVVSNASGVPSITSSLAVDAALGRSFSYTIATSVPAAEFAAVGLPPGISLDSATGTITGVPAEAGVFYATIRAINDAGDAGAVLKISIGAPPVIIREPDALLAWQGEAASLTVAADSQDAVSFHWRRNGLFLEDGENLIGSRSPELQFSSLGTADSGTYDLRIVNRWGETWTQPVTVQVHYTLAQWIDHLQLLDPDNSFETGGAGITRLVSYAFGIHPLQPERSRLPRLYQAAEGLTLRWRQSGHAAVELSLEGSVDLMTWRAANHPLEKVAEGGEGDLWQIRIPAAAPHAFYRLRIQPLE